MQCSAGGELFVSGVLVQTNGVGLEDGYRSARSDSVRGVGQLAG